MLECLLKEFTSLIKMYDVTKIKSLYFGGGGKIILHLYTYNKPSMVGFFCPKKLDEESDRNPPPHPPPIYAKIGQDYALNLKSGEQLKTWIYSFMYLYTYRLIHVYINITSKQWEEK